jgi:hypothetical protein
MHIASKHLQSSIVAGLITVCGLTIGFAGAEGNTLPSFALSFVQTSPNAITDGAFAGAKFDIGGYVSHPCYVIAGVETKVCEDQYGLTQSLKTYLDDGSLLGYLRANGLAIGAVATSSQSSVSSMSSASSVSSAASSTSETAPAMNESSSEAANPAMLPAVTRILNDSIKTEDDFDALRQNRSNAIWNHCRMQFNTRYEMTACFQRNMKLMMRLDTPIEGNIQ